MREEDGGGKRDKEKGRVDAKRDMSQNERNKAMRRGMEENVKRLDGGNMFAMCIMCAS